ncbi:zinc finger imprinted 3-like [Coccinella septempunctata]|uniref:zinc finger imprinted 3-like n=1 Tax=Coccinella septempunctata TaxID=41139 RepID=UPI001D090113|nr:zinc finger imprinted 3-like [Coccinella septempunctata]
MPVICKVCLLKFSSKKLLMQHHMKNHLRHVRCTICFLRFPSLEILGEHYIKRHCKRRIAKQLIKYSSHCTVRPFSWVKTKKKIEPLNERTNGSRRVEKLYIEDNIQITYGNKEITIELCSDNEESLELSIDDIPSNSTKYEEIPPKQTFPLKAFIYDNNSNCMLEVIKPNEKLLLVPEKSKENKLKKRVARNKKPIKHYKRFCLEFVKPDGLKSLDHKTGEFYICDCSRKEEPDTDKEDIIMVTSDTESSSDNGKYSFYPILDKKVYCTICGNGYRTKSKLIEHRKLHNFHCQTCNTHYLTQKQYSEHIKNHVTIYCCHICNLEFIHKVHLLNHLNIHQEQEIMRNILEMEQNYNHYLINFNSETYATSINNIASFLTQSCDYKYSHIQFYKIRCHLCFMDFFKCDFQQHLKMHYYYKNPRSYFTNSVGYSCLE